MPLSHIATVLRRIIAWLFWPALALVVWGELRPASDNLETHVWDKLLHFTAYFGLAAIATIALRANRKIFWVIAALVAIGGALEIVQGLTGRDADIYDELANTIGAFTGALAGWVLVFLHGKLVAPTPND